MRLILISIYVASAIIVPGLELCNFYASYGGVFRGGGGGGGGCRIINAPASIQKKLKNERKRCKCSLTYKYLIIL
jgi:mevalonate kinase